MTREFEWSLMEVCERLGQVPSTLDPGVQHSIRPEPWRQGIAKVRTGKVEVMRNQASRTGGYVTGHTR